MNEHYFEAVPVHVLLRRADDPAFTAVHADFPAENKSPVAVLCLAHRHPASVAPL